MVMWKDLDKPDHLRLNMNVSILARYLSRVQILLFNESNVSKT